MPLLDYQLQPTAKILRCLETKGKGILQVAPCRTGKTYTIAQALREAQEKGFIPQRSTKLASVFWLTEKNVKIQTTRVLAETGVKNFTVESYASLSRSFGEAWLEWVTKIERGETIIEPLWREEEKPDVLVVDECQRTKNPSTSAAMIVVAASQQGIPCILSSATPFVTVAEARTCALATGLTSAYNWPSLANSLAGPRFRPDELNNEAIKRLNTLLEDKGLIVKFENIHYPHRTINNCYLTEFESVGDKEIYARAYLEYLEALAKANKSSPEGIAAIWVAKLKYRQTSELLRKKQTARRAIDLIKTHNRQIIIASNFVETLRAMWKELTEFHHLKKDQIGFVVGSQNELERQKMVDNFQCGKIGVLLATLKAGGVGLSLHHCQPEARPRHVLLPPTWSGIELVQMLGRAHGPTSLSTTHQDVIWLKDTIEVDVAARVKERFSCLKEIVTKKESWVDLFNKEAKDLTQADNEKIHDMLMEETTEKDSEGNDLDCYALDAF